jgi:hypothetical protein
MAAERCPGHVECISGGAAVAGRPRGYSWQRLPQLTRSTHYGQMIENLRMNGMERVGRAT